MNRGQVKRLRKELERLRTAGKEWEVLRLIERENAVDEFRSVWDDLWRSQTRHAFRTAALMDSFLQHIKEFPAVPDTIDINFMRTVGDYLEGREVTAIIAGMTGLSAPAEALRRELLRKGAEKLPENGKLRKLLTTFATTPEQIQQKEYRQLSTLLASYPAISSETREILEELFTRARKLNGASAVKNKADGVAESELIIIDVAMHRAHSVLAPPLFSVVVAPILAQICVAIRRVAELNPDKGARLALAVPFCMENLTTGGWPVLRKKFQLEAGLTFSVTDRESLRKTAQSATFEEHFLLVYKLVNIMSASQTFDVHLQDILIILFKAIFKELASRRANISARDQRRLAAVFGPFFSKNQDFLYGSMQDLPYLLDSAAAAGCLDAVSALLHAFFAVMVRDRTMIANTRSMLKLLPIISEKDIAELFGRHKELITNDLKALKGMLDISRECSHDLDAPVARSLGLSLLSLLVMNTLLDGGGRNSLMSMIMGPMSDEASHISKRLIKGMETFSGNPQFSLPVELAKSFPTGKISGKEYGHYLEKQIETDASTDQTIANFIIILETIRQVGTAQRMEMPFGQMLNTAPLTKQLLSVGLDVFCGKKEQIMRYSTAHLTTFADVIRKYGDGLGLERYMLLIGNAAGERSQAGDEVAAKLHINAMDYISSTMKTAKKRGRRR